MKFQVTVEVRINQAGVYPGALTLGDSYNLELHTLSDAAMILVRLHELCETLLKQSKVSP